MRRLVAAPVARLLRSRESLIQPPQALANEAIEDKAESLTLVLPRQLAQRIGELAKQRHTTSAALVKQIVQNAVYELVA